MLLSLIHLNGWSGGGFVTERQYSQAMFTFSLPLTSPLTKQWKGLYDELTVQGDLRACCKLNCVPQKDILKS